MKKVSLKPNILVSPDSDSWTAFVADTIGQAIRSVLSRKNVCHIMLTGGQTAERLYKYWADTDALSSKGLRFLFGDERCVPPDDANSNYALVMKTLFDKGMPSGCSIARMEAENPDQEAAAKAYEKLIPEEIDILLLGMGVDGHIASLFPNSSALLVEERSVLPIKGPKLPFERLTITPKVIASAKSIFLLVTGTEKGVVLAEALKSESDFMSLPVCLTLAGTWLLDAEAGRQLQK
jgi:6-phosphogluconolactonase